MGGEAGGEGGGGGKSSRLLEMMRSSGGGGRGNCPSFSSSERFAVIMIETFRETYRDNSSSAGRGKYFSENISDIFTVQSGLVIDSEPLISGGWKAYHFGLL